MSAPEPDRPPAGDPPPDTGAAAREALAAARTLGRQLGILASGAARGAGRRSRVAGRSLAAMLAGFMQRRRHRADAEAGSPSQTAAASASEPKTVVPRSI